MMRELFIYLSQSELLARLSTNNRMSWAAARRFVAGASLDEAIAVTRAYLDAGLLVALDHLGEGVTSPEEAVRSANAYIDAIDRIDSEGMNESVYVSLKLTAMGLDITDELAEEQLRRIVDRGSKMEPPIFVRVDMEGSPHTQRTLDILLRVHADYSNVGVVIQSYLYRSADDVELLIDKGVDVRLCKGAYSEPASIAYPEKSDVDASYLRLTERLLSDEARERGVYLAVASHDETIINWTKRHATDMGIPSDAFEFQMLNGVRRDIWGQLVDEGYRFRVYLPYGKHWYPYYMRRLAERPENAMFMIRAMLREMRS
jgi:proline dehydrogenase